MNKLIETLQQEDATFNDFLNCLEEIKALGDVFLLTVSGLRSTRWVRVVIIDSGFESITYEGSDIEETLIKALRAYVSVRELDQ